MKKSTFYSRASVGAAPMAQASIQVINIIRERENYGHIPIMEGEIVALT